jgi:glycosyltransferase involved in cell wall biosynthesis
VTYKIAIVVQGRFYTFDMAKALLARGHDVHLFTNYPRWAVARFGFPPERVTSYWPHGIAARFFTFLKDKLHLPEPEASLHRSFGRWAARHVPRREWDAVYCFSGVSEELLDTLKDTRSPSWLFRSSSHIRAQAELLETEERRAGRPIDRPSAWMIQREEREYAKADVIVTLSGFAARTFSGTSHEDKVVVASLGVDVSNFRPTADKIEARRQRILDGQKLRVLFVGTKSYRKGLLDLMQIARTLAGRFEFHFVGPEEAQAHDLLNELREYAELIPVMPEAELRRAYEWGDVFVFPTIEDGFAAVLTQAYAAGLPILATTNCGAPDFIRDEETGWILPIRAPARFVERLEWCHRCRTALADTVTRIVHEFHPRTWDDMASDLELLIQRRHQRSTAVAGAPN